MLYDVKQPSCNPLSTTHLPADTARISALYIVHRSSAPIRPKCWRCAVLADCPERVEADRERLAFCGKFDAHITDKVPATHGVGAR